MLNLPKLAVAILVFTTLSALRSPVLPTATPAPVAKVEKQKGGNDRIVGISLKIRGGSGDSGNHVGTKTNGQSSNTSDDDVSALDYSDPCFYLPVSDTEARTAGFDPSRGSVSLARCPHQSSVAGRPDGVTWRGGMVFAANGSAAPVAPPPDVNELAREATGLLQVPTPLVHMGPDPAVVAVKIPVWLWIEDPQALTATVSAGGLSVTATARVTSTVWSMGEPAGDSADRLGGPVASFTCSGLGSAPPGAVVDRSVVPPCGYTFIWRSLPERTGGSGVWPVGVTAKWTVSWVATNGQNGEIPLQAAAQVGVHVGEWRTVLVAPDGPGLAAGPTR